MKKTEILEKQQMAYTKALKKIEKCRLSCSKTLEIGYNEHLIVLPEEIKQLTWLTRLSVIGTGISELPDWIGNFDKLKSLNLGSNKLTSLPDSIGNLLNLKEINFDFNRLQTLPETFGNLVSLEGFSLTERTNHPDLEKKYGKSSWFTSLPKSFGNLTSLKYFGIHFTKLKRLPESFGNLSSLKYLNIQSDINTSVSFFPKTIKNLKSLECVRIGSFHEVPEFIAELKKLTILDLSHNQLEFLPDFIGKLIKLKKLILHSTWITELPDWIGDLKNLVELDISNNSIKKFPEIVKTLPKLKYFHDSYNNYN